MLSSKKRESKDYYELEKLGLWRKAEASTAAERKEAESEEHKIKKADIK